MQAPELDRLRLALLEGGVAPRFVERTILELREHYLDIAAAALDSGRSPDEAGELARAALGSERSIAAAVLAEPALLSFDRRWPRSARWLRAAAFYLVLPAVPVVYCTQHGGTIVRWGASVSLGMMITSALLFLLQSFIA